MMKFICTCGHIVITNGTEYRAPCPKCGNRYLTKIIVPRDVMVVHSETKMPQQDEV